MSHCFPHGWLSTNNLGNQSVARITVGWDLQALPVNVVSPSSQEMSLNIEMLAADLCFFVSIVYRYNLASDRQRYGRI